MRDRSTRACALLEFRVRIIIINQVTLHEREIRLSSPLNLSAQSTNQEHLLPNTDNIEKIQAPSEVEAEPGLFTNNHEWSIIVLTPWGVREDSTLKHKICSKS